MLYTTLTIRNSPIQNH